MILEVTLSIFLTWFTWYTVTTYQQRKQMPPGPIPLPLIGNLLQMSRDSLVSFEKLQEKYGDVFTVSLPTAGTAVVLCSLETLREALITRKDDITGQNTNSTYPFNEILENKDISTLTYGSVYRFRRRVFVTALRVFTEAKSELLAHTVQNFLEEINKTNGQAFFPRKYVASALISELWRWISSEKCSYTHPTVLKLEEFKNLAPSLSVPTSIFNHVRFLRYFPSNFKRKFDRCVSIREEIFTPELKAHRDTYKHGVVRDLTDSFLSAYEKELAKESGKNVGSPEDVKGLIMNLIFGGADATASFMTWFILAMLTHPQVQKRIQAEIDVEIGRERLPRWKDADSLPYLQATICEVMRLSAIIPLHSHCAIRDTTVKAYRIPKDTTVIFNLSAIMRDPRHWVEPKSFKPDRFLDTDGKFVGWAKYPSLVPFNIGIRACPGSAVAKMEIFLFVSAFLHRFNVELPEGEAEPALEYDHFSALLFPKEYKVIAKKR